MDPKTVKKALEKRKSERDRLSGRLDSLYEELGEMGFTDLNKIDEELDTLDEQIEEKEAKKTKKINAWMKKYGHLLEDEVDI